MYQQYTDNEADTDTSLKIYTKESRVYGCEETIVNITKAKTSDVKNIMTFYNSLITTMSQDPYRPKWIQGVYPSLDDIKRYCGNEECYLAVREEKIIGAVMIVHDSDENHTQIAWNVSAPKNEITTLHLLAVDPKLQGRSIGFKLMNLRKTFAETEATRLSDLMRSRKTFQEISSTENAAIILFQRKLVFTKVQAILTSTSMNLPYSAAYLDNIA